MGKEELKNGSCEKDYFPEDLLDLRDREWLAKEELNEGQEDIKNQVAATTKKDRRDKGDWL